jgi:hypothetical protein
MYVETAGGILVVSAFLASVITFTCLTLSERRGG